MTRLTYSQYKKKNTQVPLRIFLFILLASIFSIPVAAQQWYNSPVSHGRNIYAVYPHSRTNIVAAGGSESNDSLQDIFYSYTGGMIWDFGNHTGGGYIRSLDFADSLNGLAVGYAGKILKSVDGGASWSRIFPPGAMNQRNFTTVHYTNPQTVFAFGGRNYTNDTLQTIIKSTDGGDTWNTIRDVNGRWLKGAFFIDADKAFAVGSKGTIIKTTDGGNNWTPVNSPVNDVEFNAVYFINSTTGFIVGGNYVMFDTLTSQRTILKTTDGGANWNVILNEPGGWLTAIDFIDQNTGYIAGDGATLYKTGNGGNTWVRELVPASQSYSSFTSIKFLNQDFVVMGGLAGEVYFYSTEPLPEVFTEQATVTQITDTSASVVLRATINTHGNPVTYNFVYSTTPDFSSDVNAAFFPSWPIAFNSYSPQLTETIVNNLLPDTTYYYYVTVTSMGGVVTGGVQSFVTTVPYNYLQTHIPQTNLLYTVFLGVVGSPEEPVNAYFEYGTTTQFGAEVQATPFLLNDTLNYNLFDTIYDLLPNTLYYCRLKVVSQTSTYYANTVAFFIGNLYANFEATQATTVTSTTATLNAEIDNFRLPVTDITFLYGTNPAQFTNWVNGVTSVVSDTLLHTISVDVTGLSPNTFYYYKITGETVLGQQSSNTASFYTGDYTLNFQALPATTVGENFATLNGSISGLVSGHLPAEIIFEYGSTTALGQVIQSTPFTLTDTLSHDLTAFINALTPGSTYYFRVTAQTQAGVVYTNLQSFITALPGNYFSTLPAKNITGTTATLNGKITNTGFPVTLSFQYGLTENLGTETTSSPENINDTLYHLLSAEVTGLIPDTLYYFRVKASFGNENIYTTTRQLFTAEPEIPNWNFEQWQPDTLVLPAYWNILSDSTFERVQGYSGNYALKLTETNFAMMGFPGDGSQGAIPKFYGGCPFNQRPDSVIFYLDYYLNPEDTAMFMVHLRNTDTIISAKFNFITGNSGGTFQRFAFPIEYLSGENPDTLAVGVTTFNPFSAIPNDHSQNYMTIDDISFYPPAANNCNIGFEDWVTFPYDNLKKWHYPKSIHIDPDNIENSQRVLKTEGYEGQGSAVELRSIPFLAFWASSDISNSPNKDMFGGNIHGTPVSRRYRHLNGYYKYQAVPDDSLMIDVNMFKNTLSVGQGMLITANTDTGFLPLDILINYTDGNVIPDSVIINIKSNNFGLPAGPSVLIIDRLGFDGLWGIVTDTTGIETHGYINSELNIYPNPAKNNFTVELHSSKKENISAEFVDINGRVLLRIPFPQGQTRITIDGSSFEPGFYLVRALTDEKILVRKVVIVR